MHMADALVAPAVAATMYTASAVTAGVSVHKLRKDDSAQKLPTMAVMSSSKVSTVLSGKDSKPCISSGFKYTLAPHYRFSYDDSLLYQYPGRFAMRKWGLFAD